MMPAAPAILLGSLKTQHGVSRNSELTRPFILEVFPDAFSMPHDIREQWRLLQPMSETEHFVVSNQGWS